MREQHRRKNFKIGDQCDGINHNYVVSYCLGNRRDSVNFVESYYTMDENEKTIMLKLTVYRSKLVLALCVK
jgi:hypothetical protein